MKTGKFLVKANYIKPAKEEWVICDVRLLTDNIDNFLCIKSSSPSDIRFEDSRSITATEISMTSTLTSNTTMTMGSLANRPFTALCNLSEYRSCDIRTTTINGRGTFALKLVPAGILCQKRLLMATDDEEQLTSWLSMLKGLVGKKQHAGRHQSLDTASPVLPSSSSTMGSVSTMGSLDRRSQNTFSFEDDDEDAGLTENDIYEPYSVGDYSQATVQDTPDARRLNLHGEVFLRTAPEDLEIAELTSRRVLHKFPYKYIRRFGSKNGVLRIEAGRRCTTGDGMFAFQTDHSPEISIFIREAARKLKEHKPKPTSSTDGSDSETRRGSPGQHQNTPPLDRHGQRSASGESAATPTEVKRISPRQQHLVNNDLPAVDRRQGSLPQQQSPQAGLRSAARVPAGGHVIKIVTPANGCSRGVTGAFVAKPGRGTADQTVTEEVANHQLPVDNDPDSECHYDNMSPETYGNLRCPVVAAPRAVNCRREGDQGDPNRCLRELDEVLRELGISGGDGGAGDVDDGSIEL